MAARAAKVASAGALAAAADTDEAAEAVADGVDSVVSNRNRATGGPRDPGIGTKEEAAAASPTESGMVLALEMRGAELAEFGAAEELVVVTMKLSWGCGALCGGL